MNHAINQSGSNRASRKTPAPLQTPATLKRPTTATTEGLVASNPSPLVNRKNAARQFGIEVQTLASWAYKGSPELPYIKVGRKVMYRQSDLDAFVNANAHGARQNAVAEVAHGS